MSEETKVDNTNEALGLAGAGVLRTLDGVEFTFMPLNGGMKAAFSAWIQERDRQNALDTEKFYLREARKLRSQLKLEVEHLDDSEREDRVAEIYELEASAKRQMADFDRRRTTGKFHYLDEICQEALQTFDGSVKTLQLMLQPRHRGITFEAVAKLFEKHADEMRSAAREANNPKKQPTSPDAADGSRDQQAV